MRRVSKKTAARIAECREFRAELVREVGHCELCGHDPSLVNRLRQGRIAWALHVHEIARGPHRMKALDKRFALLVVCYLCHEYRLSSRAELPEARQLAALLTSRPHDFDLPAFNALVGYGPRRITEEEVDAWRKGR